jgi:hypothetical protein
MVYKHFGDYISALKFLNENSNLLYNYLEGSWMKTIPFDLFIKCDIIGDYTEIHNLIKISNNKQRTLLMVKNDIENYERNFK